MNYLKRAGDYDGAQNGQAPFLQDTAPADSTNRSVVIGSDPADQEAHARTHALLVAVLEKLETSTPTGQSPVVRSGDWLSALLNGKGNGLLGFLGNSIAVWTAVWTAVSPLLIAVAVWLLKAIPSVPQFSATVWGTLLPSLVLTALAGALASVARLVKRKPARVRFLLGVLYLYSGAMIVYLIHLSLGFLHDNFAGGFLFAFTWVAILSLLRQVGREARAVKREMAAAPVDRPVDPPSGQPKQAGTEKGSAGAGSRDGRSSLRARLSRSRRRGGSGRPL